MAERHLGNDWRGAAPLPSSAQRVFLSLDGTLRKQDSHELWESSPKRGENGLKSQRVRKHRMDMLKIINTLLIHF